MAGYAAMSFKTWHEICTVLLENKHMLIYFPEPPAYPCFRPECQPSLSSRRLMACKHSLWAMYRQACSKETGFAGFVDTIKKEMRRWHPDRLTVVPPVGRADILAKATELFQFLSDVLDKVQVLHERGLGVADLK